MLRAKDYARSKGEGLEKKVLVCVFVCFIRVGGAVTEWLEFFLIR